MKLSLTIHNTTYSVESDDGYDHSDVYELAEQFKGLLVNAGFHPTNVDSLFNLDYEWFTEKELEENLQGHLMVEDVKATSRMQKKIDEFQNNMYRQDDDKPL